MSKSLPLRANLEWLKKTAKERLDVLRATDPKAQLSDAQLAVARDYGCTSWRDLHARVDLINRKLAELVPPASATDKPVSPDDPDLAQFLAAINAGDLKTVTDSLGRRPELARAHGPDGQTPLHVAAERNDPKVAVYLMAYRADPEAKFGNSGHTALSWAVTCNAFEFATTLVKLGAKPDLFCAAGIGDLDHVRTFFDDSGALRPGASKTGSSRYAPDGTRLPCPPTAPVEQISDALYIACRNAHAEVVRFLLTKHPDLAFRAYAGATPLHWAYFGGSPEVIDLLLQAGADAHARDDRLHCTPRAFGICTPASWGFAELVRRRLAQDPTLATLFDGHTSALHEGARSGNVEVVQMLLDAGADPALRDASGKAPAEVAEEGGHGPVAELLRGRGR